MGLPVWSVCVPRLSLALATFLSQDFSLCRAAATIASLRFSFSVSSNAGTVDDRLPLLLAPAPTGTYRYNVMVIGRGRTFIASTKSSDVAIWLPVRVESLSVVKG